MPRWRILCASLAAAAAMMVAACGGDNGPGDGSLSEEEVAALVEALTTAGVPLGADQFLLGPLLDGVDIGTLGNHDATGAQVDYTVVSGTQEGSFRWVGITGWSGFDAGAGTVARAFGAMYSFPTEGFPSSFEETIDHGDVIVWSYQASPEANYYPGEAGTFVLSSSSFGAATECPNVPEFGNGIEVTECFVSFGRMEGSLGFTANRVSGTGPETFVLPGTTYDLPATRLQITVHFSGVQARRDGR